MFSTTPGNILWNKMNPVLPAPMSADPLLNIKIRKRNVCYVVGLPILIATEQKLQSQEWFGQFGNIATIAINRNSKSIQANSIPAHITYDNDISALNAINFCNKFIFEDGRKLKATFGTQHYCRWFIAANKKCTNVFCGFRHSWCHPQDIITQKDINDFKAIPAGAYTSRNIENQPIFHHVSHNLHQPTTSSSVSVLESNEGNNNELKQIMISNHAQRLEIDRLNEEIKSSSEMEIKNKREIYRWWNELAASQQNKKNLKAKYDKIQNVFKRLELKYDDLQSKYLALDEKYELLLNSKNGKVKEFESWDTDDVIKWIINLNNKKYKKYENDLIKNIKTENIDGQCLESLDKGDLHRLGITDFKDKKNLLNKIKELITSKES